MRHYYMWGRLVWMAALCLAVAGMWPAQGATHNVVFGGTRDGGTVAKYNSEANAVVFTSPGWGTFEEMIALSNGDVMAGVTASGGSLLLFDGTSTAQPSTGWTNWMGLAELGNGNIVTASGLDGGNYSVREGVSYAYAGFGYTPLWGTIYRLTSLGNGNVVSGTSDLGGSLILHSNGGATRQQFSNNWGSFDQLIELSDGIVLAGTSVSGGSFVRFDGAAFNSLGIGNAAGWGTFEQMVAIDNGRAVAGVSHLGGTLVLFDGNANQINTGWGTFEQMIALDNGDVVFGSTLSGGTIGTVTGGTTPSSISTGQGAFYGMAELSDGRVLIATGQGGGTIVILDGATVSTPTNALGWGPIDQVAGIGDGEAFLTSGNGELLRFDGSGIIQVGTGWGVVEKLVTVAAPPPPTVRIVDYSKDSGRNVVKSTGTNTWSVISEYTTNPVAGESDWHPIGDTSRSYLTGINTITFDSPVTNAQMIHYRTRQSQAQPAPPGTWIEVQPNAAFPVLDGGGALVFDDKMWLLGGWAPGAIPHPYTTSEVWVSTDGTNWVSQGTAPWEPRHTAGYVVYDDKMWIVGGDANSGHYQNDVWNTSDGTNWTQVTANVPWGDRVLHHTVAFDGRIWVMGGQKLPQFIQSGPTDEMFYNDVWCTTNGVDWTRVLEHAPWEPRGMIGGNVVFQDKLWLLGGGTYDTPLVPVRKLCNDVWNTEDGVNWTLVVDHAPWRPRQYHDVAVFDDLMWVLEGAGPGNRNDVWFSSDGVTWFELQNTPWPARHAASVFVYDGGLWMVAGNLWNDVWKLVTAP